jgi:high-affinity iron transporter
MWRHGRRMKLEIEGRLAASALKSSSGAFLGVFLFTLLMITREGMETALLLGTLLLQISSGSAVGAVTVGALGGLLAATGVAWLWSRYGHRVNLAVFFQVTAVFLAVFVVQLFIYGIHELTEANVLPYSEPIHWATEPYGPDGLYGQYLSYALVALPVGWLAFVSLFRARKASGAPRIGHHAAVRNS